MNINDAPYLDLNKDRKYTFYCLIIKGYDEDNATIGTQELVSKLTGYAINEWVFRTYLRYYKCALKYADTIMVDYPNMTYNEFQYNINKDFEVSMTEDNCIDMDFIGLIHDTILYNGLLSELFYEYRADFDDINNTFIPALFQGYELLCLNKGQYFTEEFSTVVSLLNRVCKLYVPIVKLLDSCGCDDDEWFTNLPDTVKVNLTKEANFPKPLEELSWFDVISAPYSLYYFIHMVCDYTGTSEDD